MDAEPCPIDTLPNELLLKIVSYCPHFDALVNWDKKYGKSSPHMLNVAQVCRRWRRLTIAYSYLWTRIPLVGPCWLDLFIERSQELPLTIVCHYPLDRQPIINKRRIVCSLLRALHRIHTLSSCHSGWLLLTLELHVTGGGHMPHNELAHMVINRSIRALLTFDQSDCFETSHWKPIPVPASLRRLVLDNEWGGEITNNLGLFQAHLTSLMLHTVDVGEQLLQLMSILDMVHPTLEHLSICHLKFQGYDTHTNILPALDQTKLPRLRSLRLIDMIPVALAVAESLVLPPCLELVLVLLPLKHDLSDTEEIRSDIYWEQLEDTDRRINEFLHTQYAAASAAGERFTSLHIVDPCARAIDEKGLLQYYDYDTDRYYDYEYMVCCELQTPATHGALPPRITVALQYEYCDPGEGGLRLLDGFPPLDAVRSLYTGECINNREWPKLAKRLAAVEHLCMWVDDEDDFEEAEDSIEEAGGGKMFPALHSIKYHTGIFDKAIASTMRGLKMGDDT